MIAKRSADLRGKGFANVEEGEGLEDLRKHADVLKVDDPDSFRIDEEVLLLDVRVVDSTMVPE